MAASPTGPQYTVSEAIDGFGFGKFQVWYLFAMGLSWISDAMEVMLLAFIGPILGCEWGISPIEQSGLTLAVFVGMGIGAASWGRVADIIGRRRSVRWSTAMSFVFGVVSTFAPNYSVLIVSRLLVGAGIGGVPVVYSLFLEFVPSHSRGMWSVGKTLHASKLVKCVCVSHPPGCPSRWSCAPCVAFQTFPLSLCCFPPADHQLHRCGGPLVSSLRRCWLWRCCSRVTASGC